MDEVQLQEAIQEETERKGVLQYVLGLLKHKQHKEVRQQDTKAAAELLKKIQDISQ